MTDIYMITNQQYRAGSFQVLFVKLDLFFLINNLF